MIVKTLDPSTTLGCFISAYVEVTGDLTQGKMEYQDRISLPDTCRDLGCSCDDLELLFRAVISSLPHLILAWAFPLFSNTGSLPAHLLP